jgi:hypothetical protein
MARLNWMSFVLVAVGLLLGRQRLRLGFGSCFGLKTVAETNAESASCLCLHCCWWWKRSLAV